MCVQHPVTTCPLFSNSSCGTIHMKCQSGIYGLARLLRCLQVCYTVTDSYWQCVEAAAPHTKIAPYAQCGGSNCLPVLGDLASQISCENAPWSGSVCADTSTSCQRLDDYMWQCLPTASEEEEAAPEEASIEEEGLPEEAAPKEAVSEVTSEPAAEATPAATPQADSNDSEGLAGFFSSAKDVGAKAIGGVKDAGVKAMSAVKSLAGQDDEEADSPAPAETQAIETSTNIAIAASESNQTQSPTQDEAPSTNEVAAYAQCGGMNCLPALGDSGSDIACENAAWANTICSDSTTTCQRVDDYMWQCLPADADADSASETSPAADADSENEDDGSTAKDMGAKALEGVKARGSKALEAVKSVTGDDSPAQSPPVQDDSASEQDSSLEGLMLPDGDDDSSDESGEDSADDSAQDSGDLDILTFVFNMECLQVAPSAFCLLCTSLDSGAAHNICAGNTMLLHTWCW